MNNSVHFDIIGKVTSPYKEKFAIPRQPGLVSAAKGKITLIENYNNEELIRGLEQFSHIWVLFVFHATQEQGWKPLVRPPRLGGNKKIGTLATRSTFRPNPIGMSAVQLEKIEHNTNIELYISGIDLLDQTPVIDIKPYIPYSDVITHANAGYAQRSPIEQLAVIFSESAKIDLQKAQISEPNIKTLISQILAQDPRPAYKQNTKDEKTYGIRLYHFNIKWYLCAMNTIEVTEIK